VHQPSLPHRHQALFDLEATNNELKADLRDLYITAAKEVDTGSRKAIIVQVRVC
jgi:small subunit ribosomal protein S7e